MQSTRPLLLVQEVDGIMKNLLRAVTFAIAFWTKQDDYEITPDKRLYRFLKWLYPDEVKPFGEN